MRSLIAGGSTVLLLLASSAWADTTDPSPRLFPDRPIHARWHISWLSAGDEATLVVPLRSFSFTSVLPQTDAQPLHPQAVEHSSAYQTRAKIHKYASFATLPLFAAELALGQSLDNTIVNTPANTRPAPGGKKAAHALVGVGIAGLFAVNTVTGAWNLFGEGWRDTDGRTLRLAHGLLMMVADAGIFATTITGPHGGGRRPSLTYGSDEAKHRNIAIASISVATVGYLLMLFGNH